MTEQTLEKLQALKFEISVSGNIGKKAPVAGKAGSVHCSVARNNKVKDAEGNFVNADPTWFFISAFDDNATELAAAEPGQQVNIKATVKLADIISSFENGYDNIPATARSVKLGFKKGERKQAA